MTTLRFKQYFKVTIVAPQLFPLIPVRGVHNNKGKNYELMTLNAQQAHLLKKGVRV